MALAAPYGNGDVTAITASGRMLRAALYYAKRNLAVFPIWPVVEYGPGKFVCTCKKGLRCDERPGKHPLGIYVPHGCNDATTDPTKVNHWWACRPDANIGIACNSELVVLDVDVDKGGLKSITDLQKSNGRLPPTWRARTGSGGFHHYFRPPPDMELRNTVSSIAPGLDTRAKGGFVVAPPSNHVSGGSYEWEWWPHRAPLADLPEWLTKAAATPARTKPTEVWRALVRNGVTEGSRNNSITSLAGHLLRRHIDPLVALELIISWNHNRCSPPLPDATVAEIVDRIAGKELARRGHK